MPEELLSGFALVAPPGGSPGYSPHLYFHFYRKEGTNMRVLVFILVVVLIVLFPGSAR